MVAPPPTAQPGPGAWWQEVETLLCSVQQELVPEAHKKGPFCFFWVLTHFLYGAQRSFVPLGPAELARGAGAAGATAGCCCQRVSSAKKKKFKKSRVFFPACSCKHSELPPGSRAPGLAGWEQPVPAGPGSACSRCGDSGSIRPHGAARPRSSCRRRREQGASPGSVAFRCCNPPGVTARMASPSVFDLLAPEQCRGAKS